MAIHLTPTELAREAGLERRDVIEKCMEMGVPIFQGRIDKTLFLANLPSSRASRAHGRRRVTPRRAERAAHARRIASSGVPEEERGMQARVRRRHSRRGRRRSPTWCAWPPSGSATTSGGPLQARRRVARRHVRASRGRSSRRSRRGLVDLGIAARRPRRDPLHAPAPSGPTRTSAITSAGGVVVPIYPTNSPEECEWVAGNSEARFVVCEDAEQVAKIVAVRDGCPLLEASSSIEPAARATPSPSTSCASAAAGRRGRGRRRAPRPSAPRTPTRSSTRRARPARRRAACSRHGNYRAIARHVRAGSAHRARARLPLPAARALVRAADPTAGASTSARRSPTGAATRSRSSPS